MTGRAPVKTAIIGYGMAARVFHAPLIQACADLSLAAVSTSRSDGVAADIAVRPVEALLDDGEVQLIVVATPNDTHFEIAQAALGAGKHVVVDKPFTVFSRDADSLAAQAHLVRFYAGLGFERSGEPYEEDGIPHLDMRRPAC